MGIETADKKRKIRVDRGLGKRSASLTDSGAGLFWIKNAQKIQGKMDENIINDEKRFKISDKKAKTRM